MMHSRPLIAGNWKMYKTNPEAVRAAQALCQLTRDVRDRDIMIAPAFTALASVAAVIQDSQIALGAQDLFWKSNGAYTGEVSASMLVSAGCRYVIIGHSERRQYFGETDQTARKKIQAALEANLVPILCVGESDREREAEQTFSVLEKQLELSLNGFSAHDIEGLVVAYEPVWAIGTGKTATSQQAQEVHFFLRSWLAKAFAKPLAKSTRILYGGSVKPENIGELMARPDVDGALVGGASLDPETFGAIVKY